jgi:hypothetical protein
MLEAKKTKPTKKTFNSIIFMVNKKNKGIFILRQCSYYDIARSPELNDFKIIYQKGNEMLADYFCQNVVNSIPIKNGERSRWC